MDLWITLKASTNHHTLASAFQRVLKVASLMQCFLFPCLSLSIATRESAFVHAIASAGVAFAVTRSCAEGTSTMCGCDSHHKGPPGEGWKWGGCSEDAEFGVLVSREFADARENRPDARSAMNRHNNEAGRMVRSESCCSYNWSINASPSVQK